MVVDYFVVRRQHYDLPGLYLDSGPYPAWNVAGFVAFLVPVAFTLIAITTGALQWFYTYGWFTGSFSAGSSITWAAGRTEIRRGPSVATQAYERRPLREDEVVEMSVLIKGGTIVTADQTYRADVLCADGKIVEIAQVLRRPRAARSSMPAASSSCRVASTRTRTCSCRSWERWPATISSRALPPVWPAARR